MTFNLFEGQQWDSTAVYYHILEFNNLGEGAGSQGEQFIGLYNGTFRFNSYCHDRIKP
jgi:hypothetical protein